MEYFSFYQLEMFSMYDDPSLGDSYIRHSFWSSRCLYLFVAVHVIDKTYTYLKSILVLYTLCLVKTVNSFTGKDIEILRDGKNRLWLIKINNVISAMMVRHLLCVISC